MSRASIHVIHLPLQASNVLINDVGKSPMTFDLVWMPHYFQKFQCVITDFGQSKLKSEAYRISGTKMPSTLLLLISLGFSLSITYFTIPKPKGRYDGSLPRLWIQRGISRLNVTFMLSQSVVLRSENAHLRIWHHAHPIYFRFLEMVHCPGSTWMTLYVQVRTFNVFTDPHFGKIDSP